MPRHRRKPAAPTVINTRPPYWWEIAWLVASQIIGLYSLGPWLAFATQAYLVVTSGVTSGVASSYLVLAYPVLPVACAIIAWILFALKQYRTALIVTSLPLLVALPLDIYYIYVAYLTP